MADIVMHCGCPIPGIGDRIPCVHGIIYDLPLTPSADLPACRDEATDPPEYQHPEDEEGARLAERDSYIGTWSNIDITKRTPDE